MPGKSRIKQKALVLSIIYLFLSGYMMVGEQRHVFEHARRGNHTTRHASLTCSWMCATSASVDSANPSLNEGLNPSFEDLVASAEPFPVRLSVFYFHGRSPPVGLS